jgi:hypothetical protein
MAGSGWQDAGKDLAEREWVRRSRRGERTDRTLEGEHVKVATSGKPAYVRS